MRLKNKSFSKSFILIVELTNVSLKGGFNRECHESCHTLLAAPCQIAFSTASLLISSGMLARLFGSPLRLFVLRITVISWSVILIRTIRSV